MRHDNYPFIDCPGVRADCMGLSNIHYGKYARVLSAEYEASLLMPVTDVLGLLAIIQVDSPHDVN